MKREDFQVGQTVIHYDHGRATPGRFVRVTKVGRTNVTVEMYGRECAFRMDTGYATRDFGGRILTEAEAERERQERHIHAALAERGVRLHLPRQYPLETWAAVLNLLIQAEGAPS